MGLFILVILVLIVLYLYMWSKSCNTYLKNVPGPKPIMFFGNLLDFAFLPTYKYLDILWKYLKEHGNIVKVHDGPLSVSLIVADVKFIEHVLSSTKLIDKADQYMFFHSWLGEGLLVSTGTKWKKRRRMLTPAFHFSILENFVEVFETVGDVFIEILGKEVEKKSVEISEYVSLCTLDVMCEAAMGIKINAQTNKTSKYVRSVKSMCYIFLHRMLSTLDPALYPFTYTYFVEKSAVKIIHAHTYSIIDKRIAENKQADANNITENGNQKSNEKLAFLDLLLKCTMDGEALSRSDIREEVDTFMFEGHDTTSSAISFALFALATNPHVQEKAVQEQHKIYENFTNATTTVAQLQEMKYLELVIKETLRLYPSVPVLGRKLPEDLIWENYHLPKGLNMMLSTIAVHRDPQNYPEPLKFIPERFEDMNLLSPYMYTPFSAGPRNCIGQKFAMLEMKSVLSKVLRNFELLPATPYHELQLAPETILVSKNGVRISLKKRQL